MGEFEKTRNIVRRMKLAREQARDIALKGWRAAMDAGDAREALQIAEEWALDESCVTGAAEALFEAALRAHEFPEALRTARGYHLAVAPYARERFDPERILGGVVRARDRRAAAAFREIARIFREGKRRAATADEALALIRDVAKLNLEDPLRRGRATVLPDRGIVFLVGDLHGNADNLCLAAKSSRVALSDDRFLILQEVVHSRLLTTDKRDLSFIAILEALRLKRDHGPKVHILLGNHDLGLHMGKDLIKAGRSLNHYLYRGMDHLFPGRGREVLDTYARDLVPTMPIAAVAPNGILMTHSTPAAEFAPRFTPDFFTTGKGATRAIDQCKEIIALVNGRDFRDEVADTFAERTGFDLFICGHTPDYRGHKTPSARHVIIDSQHALGCFVHFDLDRRYTQQELVANVSRISPVEVGAEAEAVELM